MKHLKLLGMAIVAVAAMTAFLGAGSASATVLCKTATSPCTGGTYGSGTAINASLKSGTAAELTTSLGTVVCNKSGTNGKTTSAGGGAGVAVTGTLEALTFEECKLGTTSCTVASVHKPYNAKIAWTSGSNGNLEVGTSGAGNPGATVKCGIFINCEFTTASAVLGVTGGTPALAEANNISLSRSGGICPSTSTWKAVYSVTTPSPLFIANS
jgi:hypothetical protein